MVKFSIIKYTKKVMADLEQKNLYMTHMMIAYKVIIYYQNNIGEVTNEVESKLSTIIDEIYEIYLENNDTDLIDELVEEMFKKR